MPIASQRSASPQTVKRDPPAGPQHAVSLGQRPGRLGHVVQAEAERHRVERLGVEGEVAGLADPGLDVREPLPDLVDHLVGEVEGDDRRAPCQGGADQGAWPGADIEHVGPEPDAGGVQRRFGGGAGHRFEPVGVGGGRPPPHRPVVVVDAGDLLRGELVDGGHVASCRCGRSS